MPFFIEQVGCSAAMLVNRKFGIGTFLMADTKRLIGTTKGIGYQAPQGNFSVVCPFT